MKIFNSIQEFTATRKTIVTIGTFDGVHIGHKKIINRLVENAKAVQAESLILTFFPHPRFVLQNGSDLKLLNTLEERIFLLEKAGIDNLVIHPFDSEFASLTPDQFVKNILIDKFNVGKIIVGHDHRFGTGRTAGYDDLEKFGNDLGFSVEQISVQEIDDVSVSSTKIRNALMKGDIELANEFLGYHYFLSGNVVKGKQLGRTIGFPTANLQIDFEHKLIPHKGVYVVQSIIANQLVNGMMNIGTNPTVGGQTLSIEINYFDFDSDIYHQKVIVSVIKRLRDEQKFADVDQLKAQLKADRLNALQFFEG